MGRDVRENNLEKKARSLCIYHNIWNEPSLLKLETEVIEAGHIILNMLSLYQISQDMESPSPHFPTSPAHPQTSLTPAGCFTTNPGLDEECNLPIIQTPYGQLRSKFKLASCSLLGKFWQHVSFVLSSIAIKYWWVEQVCFLGCK